MIVSCCTIQCMPQSKGSDRNNQNRAVRKMNIGKNSMRATSLAISLLLVAVQSNNVLGAAVSDAAELRDLDVLMKLISEGADVNEAQNDGSTALLWAAQWDDTEMARALTAAGADPSAGNRTGASPLQLAAINGNPDMLRVLLEAGANPALPLTPGGDTA